jgi:hypothetical protein
LEALLLKEPVEFIGFRVKESKSFAGGDTIDQSKRWQHWTGYK